MKIVISMVAILLFVIVGLFTPRLNVVKAWSISPLPQATPERPLNEQQVSQLFEQLENRLRSDVNDEDVVAAILERWESQENLVGKTKTQILRALFQDVSAVITDDKKSQIIWTNWIADDLAQERNNPTSQPEGQTDEEPELSVEDVDLLIADLAEMLDELVSDRAAIGAIVSRWYNRTGLDGKTESQILLILFEDVKAVISNKAAQDDIWAYWTGSDDENADGPQQTVLKAPVKTEEQIADQTEIKELAKALLEDAKKNSAVYTEIMSMLKMDKEYEPERVAGLCYLLIYPGDDEKCKAFAMYRGYAAFMYLKKAAPHRPTIDKITALFNRYEVCEKAKDCRQLRMELIEKFEVFNFSQMAIQFNTFWSVFFDAVGLGRKVAGNDSEQDDIPPSFDPAKIAGLCLNEAPGVKIETCLKFTRASMYGFWFRFGNASAQADQARYNALFNRTVRCSAPVDCDRVIADLKALPDTRILPTARVWMFTTLFFSAAAPIREDGKFDLDGFMDLCIKKVGNNYCKQVGCLDQGKWLTSFSILLTLDFDDSNSNSADLAIYRSTSAINRWMRKLFVIDPVKKIGVRAEVCPNGFK